MKRNDWKFEYPTATLADAAQTKANHHSERLDFWMLKREELMATIRDEGIEINEKIALGYRSPKARDWDRGGEIMIRNDLQKALSETFDKLAYHTQERDTYCGWEQVLRGNPGATLDLDIEDWLFFFGSDTGRDNDSVASLFMGR